MVVKHLCYLESFFFFFLHKLRIFNLEVNNTEVLGAIFPGWIPGIQFSFDLSSKKRKQFSLNVLFSRINFRFVTVFILESSDLNECVLV